MFILQDMDYYFSHFPVLETERLILRAKTATDAEDMKTYMADENLYKYWGRNMTRQEREPSLFFGRTLNNGKKDHISWGIELKKNHRLAGEVNLFNIENDRQAMIGYRISAAYQNMGFVIEASHHEMAPAQHEIDFKYDEALHTADNIMTFKMAVRTIARRHGLHATFMPKPKFGVNGSGMHINMSLQKDGKNIFQDASDPNGLSKEAYYFIGGIMKHIKGMAAITNPLVNSYKRLVPGFEAPVYIAWSTTNRSPLIRIPAAADGEGTRIELRSPDSAANPYLTLAVCLSAGLQGIREKILPPVSINANIFALTAKERKELNIDQLPGTLLEAVEELEKDTFIQDVLGEHIAGKYIDAKRKEWHEYRSQVSEWEIQEYLYKY